MKIILLILFSISFSAHAVEQYQTGQVVFEDRPEFADDDVNDLGFQYDIIYTVNAIGGAPDAVTIIFKPVALGAVDNLALELRPDDLNPGGVYILHDEFGAKQINLGDEIYSSNDEYFNNCGSDTMINTTQGVAPCTENVRGITFGGHGIQNTPLKVSQLVRLRNKSTGQLIDISTPKAVIWETPTNSGFPMETVHWFEAYVTPGLTGFSPRHGAEYDISLNCDPRIVGLPLSQECNEALSDFFGVDIDRNNLTAQAISADIETTSFDIAQASGEVSNGSGGKQAEFSGPVWSMGFNHSSPSANAFTAGDINGYFDEIFVGATNTYLGIVDVPAPNPNTSVNILGTRSICELTSYQGCGGGGGSVAPPPPSSSLLHSPVLTLQTGYTSSQFCRDSNFLYKGHLYTESLCTGAGHTWKPNGGAYLYSSQHFTIKLQDEISTGIYAPATKPSGAGGTMYAMAIYTDGNTSCPSSAPSSAEVVSITGGGSQIELSTGVDSYLNSGFVTYDFETANDISHNLSGQAYPSSLSDLIGGEDVTLWGVVSADQLLVKQEISGGPKSVFNDYYTFVFAPVLDISGFDNLAIGTGYTPDGVCAWTVLTDIQYTVTGGVNNLASILSDANTIVSDPTFSKIKYDVSASGGFCNSPSSNYTSGLCINTQAGTSDTSDYELENQNGMVWISSSPLKYSNGNTPAAEEWNIENADGNSIPVSWVYTTPDGNYGVAYNNTSVPNSVELACAHTVYNYNTPRYLYRESSIPPVTNDPSDITSLGDVVCAELAHATLYSCIDSYGGHIENIRKIGSGTTEVSSVDANSLTNTGYDWDVMTLNGNIYLIEGNYPVGVSFTIQPSLGTCGTNSYGSQL